MAKKDKKVSIDELTIQMMRKAFEMMKAGKGSEKNPVTGETWTEVMDNILGAYEKALGLK